jgi:PAS domain S-box-containing protein
VEVFAVGYASMGRLSRRLARGFSRTRGQKAPAEVEQILRAEREHINAIIATASDPFVSMDTGGRIVEWNHRAEALFGWSRDEAIGKVLADTIIPPQHRQAHTDGLRRILVGGEPRVLDQRVEITALRRDGREVPVELAPWRVSYGGVDYFHAFIHDITERLELQAERERQRAQTEKAEYEQRLQHSQRLESLGQLAGGVAHDFNNLLAVIANYADFVASEIAAEIASGDSVRWKDTASDVEQIQRATERAARLTRQLLTFGRRDISQPEVLDLGEVVAEVEQMLRRTLGERIRLITTQETGLPPIFADRGQVEQVLVNLAVNARDAMPDGGTLTIDTGSITVDDSYRAVQPGLAPGGYVRLRISDTGTGMTKEVVERAFEPFFTSKPKGSGTGLGLATVYGIVTQSGGQVRLYSEPGLGTTVSVLLPVTDRVAAALAPSPPPVRTSGRRTVLLVEDDSAIREVVRRILERNGYQVLTATDTAHAVDLSSQGHEIDLLLTDVIMPGMLGKEVAAAVLAVQPAVRVLYMSGYAQPILASQGTLEPGILLVEKPFTEQDLLNRINHVLTADST